MKDVNISGTVALALEGFTYQAYTSIKRTAL